LGQHRAYQKLAPKAERKNRVRTSHDRDGFLVPFAKSGRAGNKCLNRLLDVQASLRRERKLLPELVYDGVERNQLVPNLKQVPQNRAGCA
jgi:hypothetical protein